MDDISIIKNEIYSAIRDLNLDLKGLTILTEAGTGLFLLTPIIAGLSGAKKVYALSKTTKYGSFEEIKEQLKQLSLLFEIDTLKIELFEKENFHNFSEIDIVTNLGHVRPINEDLLRKLNKNAVISYMCEAWEHRQQDLDIELCQKYNIPVFATNEDYPKVDCFRGTGLIALQMIFESKISLIDSHVCIISRDKFGKEIYKQVEKFTKNAHLINDFGRIDDCKNFKNLDLLIIADYLYEDYIISTNGLVDPGVLKKLSPYVKIIQYCGKNNLEQIIKNKISVYPKVELEAVRMYKTLADISYKAFIRLMTAGLKVGEGICKAKKLNLSDNAMYDFMVKNDYPVQKISKK